MKLIKQNNKTKTKQESIAARCVPPAFLVRGGVGLLNLLLEADPAPCENITLPQTSFPGGNNKKTYREAIWFDALWCVDIARNWDRHRNPDRHRYRQMSTESNGNLCWHLSLYSMNTFLSVPLSVSVSGNANTSIIKSNKEPVRNANMNTHRCRQFSDHHLCVEWSHRYSTSGRSIKHILNLQEILAECLMELAHTMLPTKSYS